MYLEIERIESHDVDDNWLVEGTVLKIDFGLPSVLTYTLRWRAPLSHLAYYHIMFRYLKAFFTSIT